MVSRKLYNHMILEQLLLYTFLKAWYKYNILLPCRVNLINTQQCTQTLEVQYAFHNVTIIKPDRCKKYVTRKNPYKLRAICNMGQSVIPCKGNMIAWQHIYYLYWKMRSANYVVRKDVATSLQVFSLPLSNFSWDTLSSLTTMPLFH